MAHDLFRFDTAAAVAGWSAIDDRVMGGVSRSRLRHELAGHAVFDGEVSLQNNGGFASVRSPVGAFGRDGAGGVVIEARGDGRQYKLNLYTDARFDGVAYQAVFTPAADAWSANRLPLAAFRASFRGRDVPGAAPLDPTRIRQIGLMIAGRQAGAFALQLRAIGLE